MSQPMTFSATDSCKGLAMSCRSRAGKRRRRMGWMGSRRRMGGGEEVEAAGDELQQVEMSCRWEGDRSCRDPDRGFSLFFLIFWCFFSLFFFIALSLLPSLFIQSLFLSGAPTPQLPPAPSRLPALEHLLAS